MITNAVNTTLSEDALNEIKNKLRDTQLMMPFLVVLSRKEKRGGFKMNQKRFDFVVQTINAAHIEPLIVPSWVKIEELENDITLYNQLLGVENILQSMLNDVKGTRMQLGTESLKSASDIYNQTQKSKDRIPGVSAIYDRLKAAFPGRGENKKSNP
jgi:hypothetical protein